MNQEFLGDRRKALEDSFFAKENEKLRRALESKEAAHATKQALAEVSGIEDDAVLEHLVAHDIGSETLAALSLIPLVEVAWADGDVDEKERKAILSAAESAGIDRGSPSAELLGNWLTRKPSGEMFAAWKEYVGALSATMSSETRRALQEGLLGRSRAVAGASGGVLGFGAKVSKAEQAVLDELEQAFRQ